MVFHKFPQSVRENWSVSSHTSRATSSETSSDLELGSIPRNRCVVTIIGVEQECTSIWTLESRSFRVFCDVLQCSQINVDIDLRTRHYITEDSELHTRRRENLKSHLESRVCCFFYRVLWVIVVLLGLVGAGFMVTTLWARYVGTPTRTSVETNHYPTWRLPFPAVTLCNFNRIFRSKAEALVSKLWVMERQIFND
jgi:hypothetical protein